MNSIDPTLNLQLTVHLVCLRWQVPKWFDHVDAWPGIWLSAAVNLEGRMATPQAVPAARAANPACRCDATNLFSRCISHFHHKNSIRHKQTMHNLHNACILHTLHTLLFPIKNYKRSKHIR